MKQAQDISGSYQTGRETIKVQTLLRLATICFLGMAVTALLDLRLYPTALSIGIAWAWSWVLASFAAGILILTASIGGKLVKPVGLALLISAVTTFMVRPMELRTSWPVWIALAALVPSTAWVIVWTRGGRRWRAIVPALLSLLFHLLDRLAYPGLYPSLHLGLSFLTACASVLVMTRLLPELLPWWTAALLHGFGASLFVAACIPSVLTDRCLLEVSHSEGFAKNLLLVTWLLVDRDGDGATSFLGGGDCDDLNPDIGPDVPDVPLDGIDQDCSGADRPDLRPPRSTEAPNLAAASAVLLVTADSLRADVVGCYGFDRRRRRISIA